MSGLVAPRPRDADGIWRRLLPTWLALILLLGATVLGAHLPLGWLNLPLALGIAAAKVALIGAVFMQLRRPDPLMRLAAGAAGLWILFLFALSFADLLTRPVIGPPETSSPAATAPQ